ncbi:hypothetical protein [uncultured Meiothermus sp.]|uniref:hypothetical protein n=1 Tax=uncultured Meiothermus sp. TaxID=157471 RepID=UPI002614AC4D|nr:hypothetical protein [uncultured Meiothermus sp.]
MANNENKSVAELPTVEQLADQHAIPAWTLAGVRVREGWPVGQRVAESEFVAAVERFLTGPTDGPGPVKRKKGVDA